MDPATGVRSDDFFSSLLKHGLDGGLLPQLRGRVGALVLERAARPAG